MLDITKFNPKQDIWGYIVKSASRRNLRWETFCG